VSGGGGVGVLIATAVGVNDGTDVEVVTSVRRIVFVGGSVWRITCSFCWMFPGLKTIASIHPTVNKIIARIASGNQTA
jgi:hypothetical protein